MSTLTQTELEQLKTEVGDYIKNKIKEDYQNP